MKPPSRVSVRLTRAEMRGALDALYAIGEDSVSGNDFARRGVEWLPRLVSSELTTLSICNLDTGHRSVVSDQPGAISAREIDPNDLPHNFDEEERAPHAHASGTLCGSFPLYDKRPAITV